jgi:hypothetical protein
MTRNDRFSLAGEPYDISAECIKTRADQSGAAVFVVEGRIGKLRVLDFSEREAGETYKEEADEVDPICEWCGRSESVCKCCD